MGLGFQKSRAVPGCCKVVHCKGTPVSKDKESKVFKSVLKTSWYSIPIRSRSCSLVQSLKRQMVFLLVLPLLLSSGGSDDDDDGGRE